MKKIDLQSAYKCSRCKEAHWIRKTVVAVDLGCFPFNALASDITLGIETLECAKCGKKASLPVSKMLHDTKAYAAAIIQERKWV